MNQSISTAQRSLEITLVRQQMDAQAEALRFINQSYIANYQRGGAPPTGTAGEWVTIANSKSVAQASTFGQSVGVTCPSLPSRAFILNTQTARIWNQAPKSTAAVGSPPFSQVRYSAGAISSAYGIWIEAVRSGAVGQLGYIDFHIRTCWNSPGSSVVSTLGTIVRLYEPR
ncbi:MAG: hypothetical protein ABIQ04_05110 [Candidatus Saccharimonadales bacterium]